MAFEIICVKVPPVSFGLVTLVADVPKGASLTDLFTEVLNQNSYRGFKFSAYLIGTHLTWLQADELFSYL